VTAAAVFLVFGRTITKERTYTATTSFVPARARTASPVAGLAAQLGVSIANNDGGESPEFYADLVRSREILNTVVDASYPLPGNQVGKHGTLADVFGFSSLSPVERHEAAVEKLASQVKAETDPRTGVIRVKVSTASPQLSRLIAEQILNQIIRFNRDRRRSRAEAEREFTEQRMAESAAELRAAEGRQQQFLEENRVSGAPALRIEQERRSREVAMRQQIYTDLAQAYEQAKIEEVRDSPVITVVESPETPLRPDPRHLLLNTVLALVLGLALGISLALIADYFRTRRASGAEDFVEFRDLARQTWAGITRPLRSIR
jgi:uncharacterized protein involved in exopolysaccharide biosynthesis